MSYEFVYGLVIVILSIIGLIDFIGSSNGFFSGKLPYTFGVISSLCLLLLVIWILIWEYFI